MHRLQYRIPLTAAAITLAMAVSSGAHAYGEDDAIRDCESRLRSEYNLSDFRHQKAEKLPGEGHKYKVTGETKIEGDKHPFGCQIEDRHVTSIEYDGPEPEGMGTAEKLAVGAAAAIAAGLVASELSKDDEETSTSTSASGGLPPVDTVAAEKILSSDESLQTLEFPRSGTKTVSGRIEGYKTTAFALPVSKGQRLEIAMDTSSSSAYFNIQDAADTSGAALFAGEAEGTNTALIPVAEDATYVIRPFLVRSAARRGSKADYTFKIERQ
ncbi:MAG: hypothetical protein U9Q81_18390 [Pseudomonadota bacterium]|nr:hypothetical protein [Pseudomonadota bacterium]